MAIKYCKSCERETPHKFHTFFFLCETCGAVLLDEELPFSKIRRSFERVINKVMELDEIELPGLMEIFGVFVLYTLIGAILFYSELHISITITVMVAGILLNIRHKIRKKEKYYIKLRSLFNEIIRFVEYEDLGLFLLAIEGEIKSRIKLIEKKLI